MPRGSRRVRTGLSEMVEPVEIHIVWGKSEGRTLISAFDRSLTKAGIHNLNLVPLSSVIPPEASISVVGNYGRPYTVGDIRYVVLSTFSSSKPEVQISAGLGWIHTSHGGLIFESNGECEREKCAKEIENGLKDMMRARGWDGEIKMKIVTHTVKQVANVMVAAIYDF